MYRIVLGFACLTFVVSSGGCRNGSAESSPGDIALASDAALRKAVTADTTLAAAERALQSGHAWQATRLLAPVLRDASRRTPAAVLLAARAAAGWDGWSEVDRLLRGQRWLGTEANGTGYELLAGSALGRGVDTVA